MAHRGDRLFQVVTGGGRLYVQRVRLATRNGDVAPEPATAPRRLAGTPPLTAYDEAPSSYLDWAVRRDTVPQVPRLGRWEEEDPAQGWRWTSNPRTASAR